MLLRCVQPFGNFEPGDVVEVPDGAVFDSFYFEKPPAAPYVAPQPAATEEGK